MVVEAPVAYVLAARDAATVAQAEELLRPTEPAAHPDADFARPAREKLKS
jgi:hypothetical protein